MTGPDPEPINILVLGPMTPTTDGTGNVVQASRTAQLKPLISAIADDLVRENPALGPITVDEPHSSQFAAIIPGILNKVEAADLVILDLSGGSQNVMYELGLVHALGLPYILTTRDSAPPFYMLTNFCIANFERLEPYDPQYNPHSLLRDRIRAFVVSVRDSSGRSGDPDSFATNPVTEYFRDLPVVDISAPAGLAAGYWRNAIRRFVRHGGYFDRSNQEVTFTGLSGKTEQRPVRIRHFVAVEPVSILDDTPEEDFRGLAAALAENGYRTTKGTISQVEELDMRPFGVDFLCRIQPDDSLALVEPGVVIDIPTTLYALQYSPRVMRIDDGPTVGRDGGVVLDQLRRRRYANMQDRFTRIMRHFLIRDEGRVHRRQVHFVTLAELPELLATLAQEA